MPNFDAGHYFLTVLAPIGADMDSRDGRRRSPRHLLREVLARMPTGERTVATRGTARDNPFARCRRTHFARFFVLDDVVFNGRVSGNALLGATRAENPLVPRKVDSLSTPFLVFVADFDASDDNDAELRSYAAELWETMHAELVAIFRHCVGFDAVTEPYGFYTYLKKCQIETTMPFNDYWPATPALPTFNLKPYLVVAAVILLVLLFGLRFYSLWWLAFLGLLALAALIVVGIGNVMAAGRVPFPISPPPAPPPDLRTVLKALYVQREFTKFVIEAQDLRASDAGDQALHAAFGGFLATHKPDDNTDPTQLPGVIGV